MIQRGTSAVGALVVNCHSLDAMCLKSPTRNRALTCQIRPFSPDLTIYGSCRDFVQANQFASEATLIGQTKEAIALHPYAHGQELPYVYEIQFIFYPEVLIEKVRGQRRLGCQTLNKLPTPSPTVRGLTVYAIPYISSNEGFKLTDEKIWTILL